MLMENIVRNLQEISGSLLVSLPRQWTRQFSLKKGSKINIGVIENGSLMISPDINRGAKDLTAVIALDEHYARRFFREYFGGMERVIFKDINEKHRKGLREFLNRFMNVQVIEESKNSIVIKCFKIEELSIEECLRRMFFLSISMMDEVSEKNDRKALDDMELSLTRFYYLLVMQIRRFISEGRFAQENQIPLIRALDCRMAAEKIEKIADILKSDALRSCKPGAKMKNIKDYYQKAFDAFISSNYQKALTLRADMQRLGVQHSSLHEIASYAKDISMLVR
jgi:phosphate uptake regulator